MHSFLIPAFAALSLLILASLPSPIYAGPLEPRRTVKMTACGPHWMAIESPFKTNQDTIERDWGLKKTKETFCNKVDGQTVPAGALVTMALRVWLSGGGAPKDNGQPGYVYYEIYNKGTSDLKVTATDCSTYMGRWEVDQNLHCYGSTNGDSKGGIWQQGDVFYKGWPQKLPPQQDTALTKLYTAESLEPLDSAGHDGPTPYPFPTSFTSDITPFNVHSHNDYRRDTAVFSALAAGCISVEADVWVKDRGLVVDHVDPGDSIGAGLFSVAYVDAIKKILDANDPHGAFPLKDKQPLHLLIDTKDSDKEKAWDKIVEELAPLRDAGYLSHWDPKTKSFVQGLLTVSVTGLFSAYPWAKVNTEATNPNFALFVDADLNNLDDRFSQSNSYLASSSWSGSLGSDGADATKGAALKKVQDQMKAAKDKGLSIRYWDISGNDDDSQWNWDTKGTGQWQNLVDQASDIGVGYFLNVNDLNFIAQINFKKSPLLV